MAERPQQPPAARRLTPDDQDAVRRFVEELPESDRNFFKEDSGEDTIAQWCSAEGSPWWALVAEGEVQAMVSLKRGAHWSAHVGELRLIVGANHRRKGLGRLLARFGLAQALDIGLHKIVVEVATDKEGDIEMFTSIGFQAEALLRDHIRDRDGNLSDLVILAHDAGGLSGSLGALGLEGELTGA